MLATFVYLRVILKSTNRISFQKLNKGYSTSIYQDALAFDIGQYVRKNDLKTLTRYIIENKDNLLSRIEYKEVRVLELQCIL